MEVKEQFPQKKKTKIVQKNPLAPVWPFRAIYTGRSGSGKTNAAIALARDYLPWEILAVYARHIDNPQYTAWKKEVQKREDKREEVISVWEGTIENVPPVEELEGSGLRKLVVFDDFILERNQDVIAEYFVSGRHKNCSVIYMTQSYYATPKIIRDNATHVGIFAGANAYDRNGLYKDMCSDMTKNEFEEFYKKAMTERFGFLWIDRDPAKPELKYRIKYDTLFIPDAT